MTYSRRHFLAGVGAVAGFAVAPKAFAAPANSIQPALLAQARAALQKHGDRIARKDIVGLVDFGVHSSKERLVLANLESGRIISTHLVSHGKGSDPAHTGWLKKFSNRPGSNASSSGSYVTGAAYSGKHGHSRRLHGLDPENSEAFDRAIVMHGASYANPEVVRMQGKLGRSLGCFATPLAENRHVLDVLGSGRLLFAAG